MPRVKYIGERLGPDGSTMHDYEDDTGGKFSVPGAVVRAPLPDQYEQELLKGFETFKHAPPAVQESERQRYNRLAGHTREDNPLGVVMPMSPENRGETHARFPNAQRFDRLNDERLLGPTPAGPSLSSRPPVELTQAVRVADDDVALHHEGLHASASDPTEGDLQKHYTSMSPREREMWRVFSALHHNDDPHRPHKLEPDISVEVGPAEVRPADRFAVDVGPSTVTSHGVPLISQQVRDSAMLMQDLTDMSRPSHEDRDAQMVADFRAKLGLR